VSATATRVLEWLGVNDAVMPSESCTVLQAHTCMQGFQPFEVLREQRRVHQEGAAHPSGVDEPLFPVPRRSNAGAAIPLEMNSDSEMDWEPGDDDDGADAGPRSGSGRRKGARRRCGQGCGAILSSCHADISYSDVQQGS
jgi:hypothetical protein